MSECITFLSRNRSRVSALLAGIHNERFPQPKNNFIWDVEVVVKFLASISEEQLSDKLLTLKLTMLMSLASAARAHEICFLDTQFLVKHHSMYSFALGKPTKTSKPGRIRPPIVFKKFSDKRLCVCYQIDLYLNRSKKWRAHSQLLLSFVKFRGGLLM